MIQGIIPAKLASSFPGMPSAGNDALADFGSALCALLAAAPARGVQASSADAALPPSTGTKATLSDSLANRKASDHPADDEKGETFLADNQPPALIVAAVPVPLPMLQQIQADSSTNRVDTAAQGGKEYVQPVSQQSSGPDTAITYAAIPGSADRAVPAAQPAVADMPQHSAESEQFELSRVDLLRLDDAEKSFSSEAGDPPNPLQAGVADSTAAVADIATRSSSSAPEVADLPTIQASPAPAQPLCTETPVQQGPSEHPFADSLPSATASGARAHPTVESLKTGTSAVADPRISIVQPTADPRLSHGGDPAVSPVSRPGLEQPQASLASAQPAVVSHPVISVNLPGPTVSDQTGSGKSGPASSAGKVQTAAVGQSSADRRSAGKERVARGSSAGQTKDAATSDAATAADSPAAPDPPATKLQPVPDGTGAPQPAIPRADAVGRSQGSDTSQGADASPQPAHDDRAVANSPLPAERPSETPFHSAQLVEKVSQSELRLGMRTGEFGNIEIRTSFDSQQVKAEISSERGDLCRALATELPGLEQRMRERDVSLSTVVVHGGNAALGSGLDRERRHQQPLSAPPGTTSELAPARPGTALQPEAWEPKEGILDVRI